MHESCVVQGRHLDQTELESLRAWIAERADWSRRQLSQALALRWDWKNAAGQLKDMAARTLLLKLEQRQLITLPPRRQAPTNRMRVSPRVRVWDEQPIECSLSALEPLEISEVSREAEGRAEAAAALAQFHYLGFGGSVGENLQYAVRDAHGRPLAFLVFGAAAWKCQDRDRFIGWTAEQRKAGLALIANNTRFLILPWVKVKCLASRVLGAVTSRLSRDWQAKYGHGVVLAETFVERERFQGTAYRAANWQRVGATTGRTRQDRSRSIQSPVKDIYLYPLQPRFEKALSR
jgi:hypothetical protein